MSNSNSNPIVLFSIDAQWQVVAIDGKPQIARADGKFFCVQIDNSLGFFQPVIRENVDANGICGSVLPFIRKKNGEWEVLITQNKRIGADGAEYLLEASRGSIDNTKPLAASHQTVTELGVGRSNSARIIGKIRCGVIDVSEDSSSDSMITQTTSWISFTQFADFSSDMMAQAVLFRFLCQQG